MALTPEALLKQQQFYGKMSAGLSGAGSLIGQGLTIANAGRGLQTQAPQQQVDAYGRPIFNLGGMQSQIDQFKPQGASFGEIAGGALSGASAGSAFGLVGAGVGFIAGGLSNAIAGGARKRQMDANRRIAMANLQNAQNMYNSSVMSYNNRQLGQGAYNDAQDTVQRMQNLFTYNSPTS